MKKIILLAAALVGLNISAKTQELTVKSPNSTKKEHEVRIELGNLVVRQSVQIELNQRVDDKLVVGLHGGYYQAPTGFLSNQKKSLNSKDMYDYKKAENKAYKLGVHANYHSNGSDKTGFMVGLYPTFVRGSYLASTHFGVMRTAPENHLQLPIRIGFQWFAKNDLMISSDFEAGVHYSFKDKGIQGYKTFNIFNIGFAV